MAWQVLITDTALADLREIVEFIAEDDQQAAERTGQRLISQALSLVTMPERYAIHDLARSIRKIPARPYLVFYHCDPQAGKVYILHFWHGARKDPKFE